MTRKCVLCKESNYKNRYSFFSAPKDKESRKSWENALSMGVTDDTYICSKHFHQDDIITHWVSGVPPHVITIKYKKCRLRPGAVPIIGMEFENNQCNGGDSDDLYELKVNRNDSSIVTIPRNRTDGKKNVEHGKKKLEIKSKRVQKTYEVRTHTINLPELDLKQENECFLIPREGSNLEIQTDDAAEDSVYYVDDDVRDYILRTEQQKQYPAESPAKKQRLMIDPEPEVALESIAETVEILSEEDKLIYLNTDANASMQPIEIWSLPTATASECDLNLKNSRMDALENRKIVEKGHEVGHSQLPENRMLFEDLLEVYTEVTLPEGWSALVIPKGHDTTIIYSHISTTNSRIPFVEKQVYIKSDLMIHCSTSTTEIDPYVHDLIKDGRSAHVQSLVDLEDFIEELDQRRVCQGYAAGDSFDGIKNNLEMATREGTKWRHTECSILMNNDLFMCSKCASLLLLTRLDPLRTKRRKSRKDTEDTDDTQCKALQRSDSTSLGEAIDALKIPEIQKIMMKECMKANAKLEARKSIKFSRTWIFLSVLLYSESPRIYRYLLLKNYLSLPSLFTVKRYLHRIKTEPRFYALFQRSIEPYQSSSNKPEVASTVEIKEEPT